MTQQEVQELQDTVEQIEEDKLKVSEALAEKIEEALEENMIADKIDVSVNGDYVL